jgi:hypothetical protein
LNESRNYERRILVSSLQLEKKRGKREKGKKGGKRRKNKERKKERKKRKLIERTTTRKDSITAYLPRQ